MYCAKTSNLCMWLKKEEYHDYEIEHRPAQNV